MNILSNFDPKKCLSLIGYDDNFTFFCKLLSEDKFPKVILLSGEKGIGKTTFISHLMHYYFDRENYDIKKKIILSKGKFHFQFLENIHSNIFYLDGSNYQSVKIEDIRKLKDNLQKTPLNNERRFVILDNIEIFNLNSLNALLKIIENPNKNNHFILINNKSKTLLDTIRSRCIEFKIMLKKKEKKKAILTVSKNLNQEIIFDLDIVETSPGNFLKFNFIFNENKLSIEDDYLINVKKILSFYKKERNIFYKDLLLFFTDYFLKQNKKRKIINNEEYIMNRHYLIDNINNFFLYNLNQNSLLNAIDAKFNE